MNQQPSQTQEQPKEDAFELDLDSDQPLTPACPLNPEDREGCEACQ